MKGGVPGADPGFQVRGAHLKKITILRQKIIFFPIAEGGAKIFEVFRVKNHDFTPKNHIVSNFRGGRRMRPPWVHQTSLVVLQARNVSGHVFVR